MGIKVRAYTDGACSGNPGIGGWGAVILLPERIVKLRGYKEETTNNQMELKAVVEAIKFIESYEDAEIEIYSDSAYVVNAFQLGWIDKWKKNNWETSSGSKVKNKDLWIELTNLVNNNEVEFIKVKGHSGNTFNELADSLATQEVQRIKMQLESCDGRLLTYKEFISN